jgi:hypothetical protein
MGIHTAQAALGNAGDFGLDIVGLVVREVAPRAISIPIPSPQRPDSKASPPRSGVNTVANLRSIKLLGRPTTGSNGIGIHNTS